MEEEISLREIIETMLDGKWIIAGVTAVAVAISAVFSFFVIDPTYKASSTMMVNHINQTETTFNEYLEGVMTPQVYVEKLKSPALLSRVIDKENLDPEVWTVSSLQQKLQIENKENTNLITISIEGKDPEQLASIINTVVAESKTLTAEQVHTQLQALMTEYEEKMAEEQKNLDAAIAEYNQLKADAGLPALILFQQTASGSQYILEANQELLDELRNLDKEKQVQYEQINTKINKLTELYHSYYAKYEEARSISSAELIQNKVETIAEAFPPQNPVGPNKMLNIAIAVVLGLMAGTGYVFLRSYWKNTEPVNEPSVSV